MALKEVSKNKSMEDVLKAIEERTQSIKRNLSKSVNVVENEKEKKASTKVKKSYKTKLKVACLIGLVGLCGAWYVFTSIPSVYDAIMALIRDIFPPVTGSPGMEYFVD
jgi:hypothetical protein